MIIAFLLEQAFDIYSGGVQRSTSKLAKIFRDFNHHVIIISIVKDRTENLNFLGIPIIYCSDFSNIEKIVKSHDIELIINQAGYSYQITKGLKKMNAQVNIINTLRINPLNFYDNHKFILSRLFKSKGIDFLDNYLVYKIILWYHILKQRFEIGYIIKNVDAFVMLSERFKADLYQLVPSVEKYDHKVFGINNPFNRPEIEISFLKKENVILHVGRLEIVQKRVDLLLEIWKKLHGTLSDWEFWVVGHGEQEDSMKRYCKDNNMNRVRFFGKQDPDSYYQEAKIFHLTSAYEGFGNVLVEAQSFGCVPILFDSYSAASDIINHNKDGILIEPFDVDSYVEKTLALVADENRLIKMSKSAYQNVYRFSYENTYQKWFKVLDCIY